MLIRLSAKSKNAILDAIIAVINEGGAATIHLYTSPMPASADHAATGTLLGTLTLSESSFNPAELGVATLNAVSPELSAPSGGQAVWGRLLNGDGDVVLDGDISSIGAAFNLSNTVIGAGQEINIQSGVLRMAST